MNKCMMWHVSVPLANCIAVPISLYYKYHNLFLDEKNFAYLKNVSSFFYYTDETPDLIVLRRFHTPSRDINIMQEVGPKYREVGNILLKSPHGVKVRNIEVTCREKVDDIVYEIFRLWITESTGATWSSLVECLKSVSLNRLAQEIGSCLECRDNY